MPYRSSHPARARGLFLALILAASASVALLAQQLTLPRRAGSVRFLVFGDTGTGDRSQYDVGRQIAAYHQLFRFTFALMLGDNMYGSERPQDYDRKFVKAYKPLIDAKVEFHAALGNHDDPNQRFYEPFNLGGQRYRTFRKGNVRFFVLDSNYLDPDQVKWLDKELAAAGSAWKIVYFHHPLYTTARRGPEVELRAVLEPLLVKHGVNIVLAGHEHIYERIKPQKGIYHFTVGGAAKLRRGDTRAGTLTDATYDQDRSFMLVEISGNNFYFQTINRSGATVDKGVLRKQVARGSTPTASTPPR